MDPQFFVQLQNIRITVTWTPVVDNEYGEPYQCEMDGMADDQTHWQREIIIEERIPADVFGHEQWSKVDGEDRPYAYDMAGLLLDQAGYKEMMIYHDGIDNPPIIKEIKND